MFFQHRKDRPDAAGLADVGIFGKAILCADQIAAKPQPRKTLASIRPGDFGLQPIEEREAQLLGLVDVLLFFLRRDADQIAQHIIVLRPVDETDAAGIGARLEILRIGDPAIKPEVERARGRSATGIEAQLLRLAAAGMRVGQIQQLPRPRRREFRHEVPPEIIILSVSRSCNRGRPTYSTGKHIVKAC